MMFFVSNSWPNPATGEFEKHNDWADGHNLAGEHWYGWAVWGSKPIQQRGAKFLPQLGRWGSLLVRPDDLDAFEAEVKGLASDLPALQADIGCWTSESELKRYLANFLRAVEFARAHGGSIMVSLYQRS